MIQFITVFLIRTLKIWVPLLSKESASELLQLGLGCVQIILKTYLHIQGDRLELSYIILVPVLHDDK